MSDSKSFTIFFLFFLITTFASSSTFLNNIHKCPKKQSEALLLFKHNLSFVSYTNDYCPHGSDYHPIIMNWNTSTDCCNWNGVTCDRSTGDVIGIDLSCGMLKGTIHPNSSLFNLPHLQTLNLAFNYFYPSQIPREIGRFSNSLTHLNLSNCWFTGQVPPDITLLHKLVSLDLSRNDYYDLKLRPDVLINMFRNFTNLEQLSLEYINISSVLPTTLNISSSLKLLNLQETGLHGKLHHYFFNLQSLETLYLSDNHFTGDFPSIIPVNLTHLTDLDLSWNKLNGTLPSWLFISPSLEYLSLSHNMFGGLIPQCFGNISSSLEMMDLGTNQLQGPFPTSICNMSSLRYLDISNNRFGGSIPQCFGNITSYIYTIDMGNNSFQGTIPSLYDNCENLQGLILKGNQLEGEVPISLSRCQSLKVLDLGNNHLNGTLPDWLGDLPNLQALVLKSNNFHGHIQPSLTAESPFTSLRVLDLSHNGFVGQLPTKYFQNFSSMKNVVKNITKPEYLDMRGEYYSFVVAVKGVDQDFPKISVDYTIIDLSNNKFEGQIPNVIGGLNSLIVLNLSHNSLTDPIPHALGNLSEIESLDLSWNQLSGEIPQSLADIKTLEVLNISQNDLVGRIPEGPQFGTFEGNSFGGNPKLCGTPLPKECGEHSHEPQLESDEGLDEESGFTWEVVMLGYGCGTLVGLVMGSYMLSTRKVKWFNAIADAAESLVLKKRKRRHVYIGK